MQKYVLRRIREKLQEISKKLSKKQESTLKITLLDEELMLLYTEEVKELFVEFFDKLDKVYEVLQ